MVLVSGDEDLEEGEIEESGEEGEIVETSISSPPAVPSLEASRWFRDEEDSMSDATSQRLITPTPLCTGPTKTIAKKKRVQFAATAQYLPAAAVTPPTNEDQQEDGAPSRGARPFWMVHVGDERPYRPPLAVERFVFEL